MNEAPALIYFFGLTGVGKSYAADILADEYDYYHYEADNDLTLEMQAAINAKQSFTPGMRDRYFEIIAGRLGRLRKDYPRVVASQATYKEQHRLLIRDKFPDVQFVWVQAPLETIQENLRQRANHVDITYAARIQQGFEPPRCPHQVLLNQTRDHGVAIRAQLRELFPGIKPVPPA